MIKGKNAVQLLLNEDCYEYGFDAILNTQTIKDEWIVNLNKKKVLYQRNNDGKPLNGLNLEKEDRMRMEIYLDDFLHNDKSLFLTEMNRNKSFDKDSELSVYHRIYNWFDVSKRFECGFTRYATNRLCLLL